MVSDHGDLSGFKQFTNRGELYPGPVLGAHSRSQGFSVGRTGSAMVTNTTSAASQKIVCKLPLCDTIIHRGTRNACDAILTHNSLLLPVINQCLGGKEGLTDIFWWQSGIGSSTYNALVYSGRMHPILGSTKSLRG